MKKFIHLSLLLSFTIVLLLVAGNNICAETDRVSQTVINTRVGVASVAFSPDGKIIASGQDGGEDISIWDRNTGEKLQTLRGHRLSYSPLTQSSSGSVNSVVFSPDGKLLVSGGSDQNVIVWDTAGWEKLRTFQHSGGGPVNSVAFSPDGKIIGVGNGAFVSLWDTTTWSKMKDFHGHSLDVTSVAFSKREKLFASGSADRTIIVWDIITGNRILTLDGKSRAVLSVDISPDGKTLISGGNFPNLVLWDLSNGALLKLIPSLEGMAVSVKYSPEGNKIVAGFQNGAISFLDLRTGSRKTEFTHQDAVNSVAVSRDGKAVATADRSGMIVLWDMETITRSLAYPARPLAQPYE